MILIRERVSSWDEKQKEEKFRSEAWVGYQVLKKANEQRFCFVTRIGNDIYPLLFFIAFE